LSAKATFLQRLEKYYGDLGIRHDIEEKNAFLDKWKTVPKKDKILSNVRFLILPAHPVWVHARLQDLISTIASSPGGRALWHEAERGVKQTVIQPEIRLAWQNPARHFNIVLRNKMDKITKREL